MGSIAVAAGVIGQFSSRKLSWIAVAVGAHSSFSALFSVDKDFEHGRVVLQLYSIPA